MTGKLVADLRKQVADLQSYIHHLEKQTDWPRITLSVTIDNQDVTITERDVEDPHQMMIMLRDVFQAHGYDLDTWEWVLRDELRTFREPNHPDY